MSLMQAQQPRKGIYRVPGWSQMVLSPREALKIIPGSMEDNNWERAVTLSVQISEEDDVWYGIEKPELFKKIREKWQGKEAELVEQAFERMIALGYLEVVENHHSWYSKIHYGKANNVVCPGFSLIDSLWMRKVRHGLGAVTEF